MTDVLLVAHHERIQAAALARQAATWLADHGHSAWMTAEDAEPLDLLDLMSERKPESSGLALSLGGDGTMLRTVKMLGGAGVPIIGVNVGLLGYLTEVEAPSLTTALERWAAGAETGGWHIEERMMLDVSRRARNGDEAQSWTALNEAVVEKQEAGHTVRLLVRIDGAVFTSYAADGLIIATPTGSTAYSLSARGPVVSPKHRALLLTPVSPHMLFDRSLVLDPDEEVEIELLGHRTATLSIDGRAEANLVEGDTLVVGASASVARFVRFGERRFHQI
ncbi:MAG TPA: NAD(+)/NADH kinase, partial [Ilumatobacteraceae bacterium]|nr:NAD(+)/NADH kinase [Ilumatobacteraceae bacterium]